VDAGPGLTSGPSSCGRDIGTRGAGGVCGVRRAAGGPCGRRDLGGHRDAVGEMVLTGAGESPLDSGYTASGAAEIGAAGRYRRGPAISSGTGGGIAVQRGVDEPGPSLGPGPVKGRLEPRGGSTWPAGGGALNRGGHAYVRGGEGDVCRCRGGRWRRTGTIGVVGLDRLGYGPRPSRTGRSVFPRSSL